MSKPKKLVGDPKKLVELDNKLKHMETGMDTTQEQNDEVGNLLARAADEAAGEAFAREISGHCKIYDVAEVTSMLAKIEGYESESRRRLRKILEPLRDERQAWRPLANVPETLSDDLERLRGQFPHFGPIIDHIELWSVLQCLGDGKFQLAPMLLLGDPGIGKTYFTKRLAQIVDTTYREIHFESATGGFLLSGLDMSWATGKQGLVFDTLITSPNANPIILMDEIDKVSEDGKYDPLGPLHTLLEVHTAQVFRDEAVPLALDASRINWIATANYQDDIPAPILSRFSVFQVPLPKPEESIVIAQSIYTNLRDGHPWGQFFAPEMAPDVAEAMSNVMPRDMSKLLLATFASAAKRRSPHLSVDDIPAMQQEAKRRIGF